jgi:hypothetical protein
MMDDAKFKAIDTSYDGYLFRSRLEARWAVLFHALGITYEYEREGYDLGPDGWYLPDFWLPYPDRLNWDRIPGAGHWLEIKGQFPTEAELDKLQALAKLTNHTSYLAYGLPGEHFLYFAHRSGRCGWMTYDMEDATLFPLFVLCGRLADANRSQLLDAIQQAKQARFKHFRVADIARV